MNRVINWLAILVMGWQISGCSVISVVATSSRMEEARAANSGKQLVPKDGTYLVPVGMETASYLGTGNTDWKINDTSFVQPKGSYSLVAVPPGTYAVYGNKRVAGGGEASSTIELKAGDVFCFYVYNPVSGPARLETYKGEACDPILRPLKNQNIVEKLK
jgi:hypothetical protein